MQHVSIIIKFKLRCIKKEIDAMNPFIPFRLDRIEVLVQGWKRLNYITGPIIRALREYCDYNTIWLSLYENKPNVELFASVFTSSLRLNISTWHTWKCTTSRCLLVRRIHEWNLTTSWYCDYNVFLVWWFRWRRLTPTLWMKFAQYSKEQRTWTIPKALSLWTYLADVSIPAATSSTFWAD